MSSTLTDLTALTPQEKRELLAQLLRQRREGVPEKSPASWPQVVPDPAGRYQPFPLTDIQQAYWVGRSGTYELGDVSIHVYFEVEGQGLDLERLTRAWRRVVRRHDMLRAIVLPDGQQRILSEVPDYEPEIADLRGLPPAEVEPRLAAIREQLSHQVLPADRWPGFELRFTRLDHDRARVHLSIDLLHLDGASVMLVHQDWSRYYLEPEWEPPPLELSYRDYVLAEQGLKHSERYRRARDYWRERIPALPSAPDLPLATSPAALTQTRFRRRWLELEPVAWQALKQRAQELGITPSAVLLTAFAEVLARWSRNPALTVNVTLSNRLPLHPQVGELVGEFTSMLLVPVDHGGGEVFEARARKVQQELWNDLEHRDFSGVEIMRELARERGPGSGMLMPVVFTSLLGHGALQPPRISLRSLGQVVYSLTQTPQVWLDHQATEDGDRLLLSWDVVETLFPPGMIDDMFEAYGRLLGLLVDDPAAWRARAHPLVPPAQLEQRARINSTEMPVVETVAYADFVARAQDDPAALALITPERKLDYGELLARAQAIAEWLRRRGAQPDTLVAVVMDKGWEQVAAALGAQLAGAAYVPVDAGWPRERRFFLLANSEANCALTQSWLNDRLEWPAQVERLAVDRLEPGAPELVGPPLQRPDHLSHVIYTSGSTGQPKGVMIEHRSVVHRIADINRRFGVGPGDRAIALTALHHDLSVYDLFGLLSAGGALAIPSAAHHRDPAHWARLMVEAGVTLWNSVPAFMEMMVEYWEHADDREALLPATLRLVMLSGDWVPVSLPDRLRALLPQVQLVSLGGPTETTVWDIAYPIDEVDPRWRSIPYGRPLANSSYHVLDANLAPRPVWVGGELYLGGIGLARGYWRDPEQTARRFLRHPVSGERLYRSGDLGRYLPDGNIEFLGREDFQVKLRGQRIELGEIETALLEHPDVSAAIVEVRGASGEERRLVGYVVPRGGRSTAGGPTADPAHDAELAEQVEFKLSRRGLRPRDPTRPACSLPAPPFDDRRALAYRERRSWRSFAAEPVTLAQLGGLLSCLQGRPLAGALLPKYRYPSAGSLYPVQTYVHIKESRVAALEAGLYYYHPIENYLEQLDPAARIDATVHFEHNRPMFEGAAFSLFLIADLDAIAPVYGQYAEDFCKLEAGYMGQLLMESVAGTELGLCPIGALDFARIRHHFDLSDRHLLIHSLLGGRRGAEPELGFEGAITTSHREPLEQRLLAGLRDKLPAHMVPATIVLLERLPLSSQGKVDRRALPDPGAALVGPAPGYVAPATEIEGRLAGLIQALLHRDRVGIHDNLFELGANSIHAVQLHNQIKAEFQIELSVVEVFRYPTVALLAARLAGVATPSSALEEGAGRAAERRASRLRRRRMDAADQPSETPDG